MGLRLSRLFCFFPTHFARSRCGEESVTMDSDALPRRGQSGVCGNRLGCATTAGSKLANVVEEDGALQIVELRGVHGDLGEEGIGHEDRGLVAMARVGVAQQGGDVDLKSTGEPVERGEGRHGLAVLYLRD